MIDFLVGASAVLAARGNEIVNKLEEVTDVPSTVTDHCRRVIQKTKRHLQEIETHQSNLQQLQDSILRGGLPFSKAAPVVKGYIKSYHDLRRKIDAIEEFFAGHITRFSKSDEFLTRTAATIWREASLPGDSPVAIASTSDYFCTLASLGIVFAPPNDVQKLLILPDLYHEFGHLLHETSSLLSNKPRFTSALVDYIYELEQQARRYSRPLPANLTNEICTNWAAYWAEEVACDTLAARLAGPAFGWCNLHLCIRHPKIYSSTKHPADAARSRHIFRVLKRGGWSKEVGQMERRWEQYIHTLRPQKPSHYDDFHPDELFIAVMEDVEDSISASLPTYKPEHHTVANLLNMAWENFLQDPVNYPEWEKPMVEELWRNQRI
jgi:hypothetical protein